MLLTATTALRGDLMDSATNNQIQCQRHTILDDSLPHNSLPLDLILESGVGPRVAYIMRVAYIASASEKGSGNKVLFTHT